MAKKVINRVYPNADEKLVKNTIVYHHHGATWYDETFEHPIYKDELLNLFLKGLIVYKEDGTYAIPIALKENDEGQLVAVTIQVDEEGAITPFYLPVGAEPTSA